MYAAFLDAIKDTVAILPFLLLIFYIIEIVEHFYSDKILSKRVFIFSKKQKVVLFPLFGALLASIPQCGLSVIASTLYIRRFISKGTLLAIYLATSDEAIPVLLSYPGGAKVLLPLILTKICIGFISGYLIDYFMQQPKDMPMQEIQNNMVFEKGCHSHSISRGKNLFVNKELFLHPFVHTLSVAFFIFFVTFAINVIISQSGVVKEFLGLSSNESVLFKTLLEPVVVVLFGIIPNCAVSVGIAMMYLKGVITFASCVSGLCAGAGLGILILIKKNDDKKDTILILALLFLISIISGYLIAGFSLLNN